MRKALRRSPPRADRRTEQARGFAYLMALFMVLAVIIASQVALQNVATAGRRERENDMIWRGNQYTRAIRLYYRKAGHYPQNLEELQKGLPDLHFLRGSAAKDPMNANGDGEWGFIYVNAAGQLFGSSRYVSLQQMALMDLNGGKLPTTVIAGATPASSLTSPPASFSASPGTTTGATPIGSANSGTASSPGSSTSSAPSSGIFSSFGATTAQKPTGPVDGPVLGAFLTGVVSKSARSSVKVYKGGNKYSDWEFIWNPLEDQAAAAQQGLAPGGGVPGQAASGIISSLFGPAPGQTGQTPGGVGNAPSGANPAPPAPPQQQQPAP
jgi:hypothetical protein